MKLNSEVIKSFLQNKRVYPTLIIVVADLLLLGGLIYFGFHLRTTYQNMIAAEDEVQQMKSTITLIRNNQSIFDGRITEYNELLEQLIPDQESYFSVISTLEQLSAKTGVFIESYSVNLGSTTEEKLTLSVTLTGTSESILNFIQEYNYLGGRLLTTESLDFNPEKLDQMTVSLNFYHNEFKDTVSSDSRVTRQDLEKLDAVREQLQ